MTFASSGAEAIQILNASPHHVVVSDMRMPGMSGADLLRWVTQEQPDTLRIILSGQSDQEGVLRSVGPAHQFLSKPCDPELLIDTIGRALRLRDLLEEPDLRRLVSRLGNLPSLPSLYKQLVDELQAAEPSGQRIGQLIGSDIAMSAKMLQLVNSAFFGMPRKITSVTEATHLLGLSTVKSLVLAAGAFEAVAGSSKDLLLLERLWSRSVLVSGMALRIVSLEQGSPEDQDAAVSAGLLHDIGILILLSCLGDEYHLLLRQAAEHNIPLVGAERSRLNATHAQVGAYLLGTWGIPVPVVEAVAHHHEPAAASLPEFGPLTALHVAIALADRAQAGGSSADGLIDQQYLEAVGKLDRLPLWQDSLEHTPEEASA